MKGMGGWKSDLHAAKQHEMSNARARQPAVYSWSLARTETQLVLLPPTSGEGTGAEDLRRILYRIPELTWDAERCRWSVPLSHTNLQQIRYASTQLPSANVSDGVRLYIRQLEAKATGRSQKMWK